MNIKKLRTKLGLSQVKFAELLGTTQVTVSAWENGKCPEYIDKLAELFLIKGHENTWVAMYDEKTNSIDLNAF